MTVKCPKCHTENPDAARFCSRCATPLPSAEETAESHTKTLETPQEELTTGSTFANRYQIIEELGKGGMGRVYKAIDKEVNAKIAIKLIKPEIASHKKTIERFRNELKIARDISHKNVCRMYDLNKEKGSYYITMEYVSGEDLKSFIRRARQLTAGTAVTIAKQVCEGLTEAHKLGVVHRDLKPQNIMIDRDGNARIMDFGIARSLSGKGITRAGVMIGTPEYMSPEQVEGKEVDPRSDIYSLGVILFEMVTGRVPFEGDTPFTIGVKHKSEPPNPPKELNEQIPDDLNRVILKCLEKDKENRYQSAQEVRSELTNIEKGIPTTEKVVPQRKPSTSKEVTVTFSPKKVLIPAVAAVILIAASVLLWRFFLKKEAIPSVPEDKPSLAVLYFENNSGEESLDNWRSGISEMLITDFSQSKFLHTLSSDRIYSVMDRLNLMEKEKYSTEDLKKVASRGGASHVIKGSFITAGEKFIINASLMNAQTTEVISSIREEGRGEVSITDSLDKITKQIKKDLNLSEEKISSDLDKDLAQITTQSPEAFKYFSQGVKLYDQQTRRSIPFFERAIKIDPEFAMAYRRLGLAYESLGLAPQAQECLEKAMELKDRVSEKERYLIEGSYYADSQNTYDKAIAAYKKLLKIYPDNTIANNNIGLLFLRLGQNEKAVYYYERARKAGTEFEGTYRNLARCYWDLGEDEKAKQVLEDYIENKGDSAGIHRVLATHYRSLGEYDRALSEIEKALSLDPNHIESINVQANIYMYKNDLKKAENTYWKLREFTEPMAGYFARNGLCSLDLIRGKYERACSWVNKGIHKARELNIKSAQLKWQIDLAYILCQTGCYEKALSKCELAWKNAEKALINSQHDKRLALHMKSLAESDLHSLTQAQKTANKLKESIGFYYHLMSRIELEKGNYLRSIDLIHKALSEDPKNERFIQTLGLAYYKAGDFDKALKQYEKIISLTPGAIFYGDIYTKSFYMLGKICEERGDTARAIENYEKFLTLWKDADSGLSEVKDARDRLAGLKSQVSK